jgi:hypothetical protein
VRANATFLAREESEVSERGETRRLLLKLPETPAFLSFDFCQSSIWVSVSQHQINYKPIVVDADTAIGSSSSSRRTGTAHFY